MAQGVAELMAARLRAAPPPPQPTAPPRWRGPLRIVLTIVMVVLGAVIMALVAAWLTLMPATRPQAAAPPLATPTTAAAQTATRAGEAKADLGTQSIGFGSQRQAQALLALIDREPGKATYNISYQTNADVVVLGVDLVRNVLVRVHQEPNNRGRSETWTGYPVDRLRNGARGGSMSDTPAGKSFGDFRTY